MILVLFSWGGCCLMCSLLLMMLSLIGCMLVWVLSCMIIFIVGIWWVVLGIGWGWWSRCMIMLSWVGGLSFRSWLICCIFRMVFWVRIMLWFVWWRVWFWCVIRLGGCWIWCCRWRSGWRMLGLLMLKCRSLGCWLVVGWKMWGWRRWECWWWLILLRVLRCLWCCCLGMC